MNMKMRSRGRDNILARGFQFNLVNKGYIFIRALFLVACPIT